MLLLIPTAVSAQEPLTVRIDSLGDSTVSGTIMLTANGDATGATIELTGLSAGAAATAMLYANTCAQPSASFAPVAEFIADADGNVRTTGAVLFRGQENVPLSTIADRQHVIGILSGGQMVACGVIPHLPSDANPALPSTGGTLDSGTFVMLGLLGFVLLFAGLFVRQRGA
jgi:hypothetical protein